MPKREKPISPAERIRLKNEAERAAIVASAQGDVVVRERVLADLEGFRKVNPLDFFEEVAPGRWGVKSLAELRKLPIEAQRFIRKMSVTTTQRKLENGETVTTTYATLELHDVLRVEDMIGKALGMWKDGDVHQHLHVHEARDLVGATAEQIRAKRLQLEKELRLVEAQIKP